jgi:drug/metabolite transporter (DMT)-like permease
VLGLFGQVAPFLALAVAARFTTSADLALMMGGAPIFTFAISRLMGQGEPWRARTALGLALGLAGVLVCVGFPGAAAADAYPFGGWGRALALLAAFGYALGATLSREVSLEVGPTMAAAASMLFSAMALCVLWLGVDRGAAISGFSHATPAAIGAMAALGFFNTALAYLVYYRLVVTAGATFAALNNYIVPFLGLIAGAVMLGEPVALSAWIGFVLVIVGVALTGAAPSRK